MSAVSLASHGRPEPPSPPPVAPPERSGTRALREGERLDLDHATAEDLELLPGIGPSTARRIVESRESVGAFRTVDDLDRVKGIGPRTVEKLRPFLRVGASIRVEDQREP
ncbi:MAG: ComEA family DNA-binding protein [Polyangiaceae bacterium]|nr:ComEA family DNA-binding protein [Polyangiaceae bacterium]